MLPKLLWTNDLSYSLRCIALVRADCHPIHKLAVSVRGEGDQRPIGDGQSLKPIARPELATPAATNREGATRNVVVACL